MSRRAALEIFRQPSGYPDAAREDRVREFSSRSARSPAIAKQYEFHGTEIRQPVAIRDFREARGDQTVWDNRDAEPSERRRP
jgi:hypothetical protein